MKIIVYSVAAHEEDCYRWDYCTEVDGKEILLAPSCLGWSERIEQEIQREAKARFGDDVEITYGER